MLKRTAQRLFVKEGSFCPEERLVGCDLSQHNDCWSMLFHLNTVSRNYDKRCMMYESVTLMAGRSFATFELVALALSLTGSYR